MNPASPDRSPGAWSGARIDDLRLTIDDCASPFAPYNPALAMIGRAMAIRQLSCGATASVNGQQLGASVNGTILSRAEAVIERGIADGAFPTAVALVLWR